MTVEVYSDSFLTPKMELFAKITNSFQLLTSSAKSSILDVWQGSESISAKTLNLQTALKEVTG